jgi:hypothetical protein
MTRKLLLFIWRLLSALLGMSEETLRFVRVVFQSQALLVAENLFLRKQLTFYQERNYKPQRLTDSARFALLFWSRWFHWRSALVVVKSGLVSCSERHLRIVVREWAAHYNHGRPHRSLGPGIPDPPTGLLIRAQMQRHQLPRDRLIKKRPVLGGLPHEYRVEEAAA